MKDEDRIGKTYRLKRGEAHTLNDSYIGRLFIPKTLLKMVNGVRAYNGKLLDKDLREIASVSMFYSDELEPLYAWKKL